MPVVKVMGFCRRKCQLSQFSFAVFVSSWVGGRAEQEQTQRVNLRVFSNIKSTRCKAPWPAQESVYCTCAESMLQLFVTPVDKCGTCMTLILSDMNVVTFAL